MKIGKYIAVVAFLCISSITQLFAQGSGVELVKIFEKKIIYYNKYPSVFHVDISHGRVYHTLVDQTGKRIVTQNVRVFNTQLDSLDEFVLKDGAKKLWPGFFPLYTNSRIFVLYTGFGNFFYSKQKGKFIAKRIFGFKQDSIRYTSLLINHYTDENLAFLENYYRVEYKGKKFEPFSPYQPYVIENKRYIPKPGTQPEWLQDSAFYSQLRPIVRAHLDDKYNFKPGAKAFGEIDSIYFVLPKVAGMLYNPQCWFDSKDKKIALTYPLTPTIRLYDFEGNLVKKYGKTGQKLSQADSVPLFDYNGDSREDGVLRYSLKTVAPLYFPAIYDAGLQLTFRIYDKPVFKDTLKHLKIGSSGAYQKYQPMIDAKPRFLQIYDHTQNDKLIYDGPVDPDFNIFAITGDTIWVREKYYEDSTSLTIAKYLVKRTSVNNQNTQANLEKILAPTKRVINEPVSTAPFRPDTFFTWQQFKEKVFQPKDTVWLVDLSASWCGWCIAAIPTINELVTKYKDKPVKFFTISLDDDKDNWLQTLKKYPTTWPQVLASKSEGKVDVEFIDKHFKYSGIPAFFAITKKGKVQKIKGLEAVKAYLNKTFPQ